MHNDTPLYTNSLHYAQMHNEVTEWRNSHKANIECARAIESAINRDFKDNHLDHDCAKSVIDQYGFDRVNYILRYTLKNSQHDLRFSDNNRKWGADLFIYEDEKRHEYHVNSHPVVLNGFIDEARDEWKKLNLYDSSHCIDSDEPLDYEGRVLVIKPSVLKDEYKTPEFQLFIATSGFGCRPDTIGRKVYGFFPKDGEETSFTRQDFIGVLKDELIPDFAKEYLRGYEEIASPVEDGEIAMS